MTANTTHRISDLLGAHVVASNGTSLGHVRDVRLKAGRRTTGTMHELEASAILVSKRRTGATLGYDRDQEQGPWIISVFLRRLHRGDLLIPWDHINRIHWSERGVETVITLSSSTPT